MRIKAGTRKVADEYSLSEIYPFIFWKECECCHDKVKREIMWNLQAFSTSRWGGLDHGSSIANRHILCTVCFPTREAVHRYFVSQTQRYNDSPLSVEEASAVLSKPCYENKFSKGTT